VIIASPGVQGRRATARAVLLRILQIALGLSGILTLALSLGRSVIPAVFTSDPAVVAAAQTVMPLLAAFMVRPIFPCFLPL
jgi:Na+-driven multidrug efflux pump